jgi:type IV pilus assembly protein PilB
MAVQAGQRLGQLLMRSGVITERQLADALEVHKATGERLGRIIVELGYATQSQILSVMAAQIGIEHFDFAVVKPDPNAVASVPRELAERYTLMPVSIDDGTLVVAMADPQNVLALDDLRIITGHEIRAGISTKDDILGAIDMYYKIAERSDPTDIIGTDELDQAALESLSGIATDAPIVKLVNYIISKP